MYIVTFYSFKGGVGRTLALVNIGIELARTGRRVILVDFDLEAPGIDTFDQTRPREPHPGIVEYVSAFLATSKSPDARDYIYEALGVAKQDGRLWVMPAGKGDEEYSKNLSSIDWQKLYDQHNGFLMTEDLKEQWKASFDPEYVLIDSRTGHTDIGGICTRQLPDAVVTLFFPNEQNLAGLKPVVSAIRSEETITNKSIELHFVMSNVPDLDDEEEILRDLQLKFRERLNYHSLTSVIHHYDSLSLLKQTLFIAERPKSRLAKEYRSLMDAITERNMEDRESIIRILQKESSYVSRVRLHGESPPDLVNDILNYHSQDKEILFLLAMHQKRRGRLKESEMLLARSLDLGYRPPAALLEQAELKYKAGTKTSTLPELLWEAFASTELDEDQLCHGVELLRRVAPDKLQDIPKTPAFRSLDVETSLLINNELIWCKAGLQASIDLLTLCRDRSNLSAVQSKNIKSSLLLSLIGLSKFSQALKLFGSTRPSSQDLDIQDAFNYAMAEWGKTNNLPKDMFLRVIELDSNSPMVYSANYLQCLSIALWAVGRESDASSRLDMAISTISKRPAPDFSCWRYMRVTPEDFTSDCEAIRKLITGKQILPVFFPS